MIFRLVQNFTDKSESSVEVTKRCRDAAKYRVIEEISFFRFVKWEIVTVLETFDILAWFARSRSIELVTGQDGRNIPENMSAS